MELTGFLARVWGEPGNRVMGFTAPLAGLDARKALLVFNATLARVWGEPGNWWMSFITNMARLDARM